MNEPVAAVINYGGSYERGEEYDLPLLDEEVERQRAAYEAVKPGDEAEYLLTSLRERKAQVAARKTYLESAKRALSEAETGLAALRAVARYSLEIHGGVLACPLGVIRLQQNSSSSVIIDSEAEIPRGYIRTIEEVSKSLIKADLEEGKEVPGARLERGYHVRWT